MVNVGIFRAVVVTVLIEGAGMNISLAPELSFVGLALSVFN